MFAYFKFAIGDKSGSKKIRRSVYFIAYLFLWILWFLCISKYNALWWVVHRKLERWNNLSICKNNLPNSHDHNHDCLKHKNLFWTRSGRRKIKMIVMFTWFSLIFILGLYFWFRGSMSSFNHQTRRFFDYDLRWVMLSRLFVFRSMFSYLFWEFHKIQNKIKLKPVNLVFS